MDGCINFMTIHISTIHISIRRACLLLSSFASQSSLPSYVRGETQVPNASISGSLAASSPPDQPSLHVQQEGYGTW